jgi:hypothetical protein
MERRAHVYVSFKAETSEHCTTAATVNGDGGAGHETGFPACDKCHEFRELFRRSNAA